MFRISLRHTINGPLKFATTGIVSLLHLITSAFFTATNCLEPLQEYLGKQMDSC